jgi:molecular chaperone HscB
MKRGDAVVVNLSTYNLTQENFECWQCKTHEKTVGFLCSVCHVIQPLENFNENPFSLLNLPSTFKLDMDLLRHHFFEAQRQFHPDRFVQKSAQEKEYASQYSSFLNEAYHQLQNPILRAHLLLKLKGLKINLSQMESLILNDVFQLREDLELAQTVDEKMNLEKDLQNKFNQGLQQIEDYFEGTQQVCIEAVLLWLTYLEKMLKQLHQMKNAL